MDALEKLCIGIDTPTNLPFRIRTPQTKQIKQQHAQRRLRRPPHRQGPRPPGLRPALLLRPPILRHGRAAPVPSTDTTPAAALSPLPGRGFADPAGASGQGPESCAGSGAAGGRARAVALEQAEAGAGWGWECGAGGGDGGRGGVAAGGASEGAFVRCVDGWTHVELGMARACTHRLTD